MLSRAAKPLPCSNYASIILFKPSTFNNFISSASASCVSSTSTSSSSPSSSSSSSRFIQLRSFNSSCFTTKVSSSLPPLSTSSSLCNGVSMASLMQRSLVIRRAFHSNGPLRQAEQASSKKNDDLLEALTRTVRETTIDELHHWTSVSLAVLVPTALVLSPSFLNVPVDLALGLVIPVHAHIGMNNVIFDYVPRPIQKHAQLGLLLATALLVLGLLKLNLCGTGITDSIKHIWRKPDEKKKAIQQQTQKTVEKKH